MAFHTWPEKMTSKTNDNWKSSFDFFVFVLWSLSYRVNSVWIHKISVIFSIWKHVFVAVACLYMKHCRSIQLNMRFSGIHSIPSLNRVVYRFVWHGQHQTNTTMWMEHTRKWQTFHWQRAIVRIEFISSLNALRYFSAIRYLCGCHLFCVPLSGSLLEMCSIWSAFTKLDFLIQKVCHVQFYRWRRYVCECVCVARVPAIRIDTNKWSYNKINWNIE